MCLAVPSKVISIDNLLATVDVMGARRDVSLILLPEDARIGEYVLVHAGFAIQKIDEAAALDALTLLREYAELLESADEEAFSRMTASPPQG
ncbi:MAG: HypC/HybG/HupF family hydrogenase formation chaperone [Nitrospirae bacterium]|nr:MAG: HypC/HybG/HupF family hydrogenase formation chaperone [Nitrospirota bacterium]